MPLSGSMDLLVTADVHRIYEMGFILLPQEPITSLTPPTSGAITGVPQAMDSAKVAPKAS